MKRPEPTAATPPAGGPPAIESRGLTNVYPHDITAVERVGCDSEGEELPTGAPLLVARARRSAGGVSWWARERRPCHTDAGIRGHGDEFGVVGRSVQAAAGGPPVICGGIMAILDVVGLYYDAWANKEGDLSGVPLAPGFRFRGPVADFDDAEGYRAMAAQAGSLVTRFVVRQQFVDGNRVCSIIDWEMDLPVSPMTSAEILEVEDGQIVGGELIYDAQELRAAMAGG